MELLRDPEFWVGIGTLVFLGLLLWKRVPALVASSLDARAVAIAKELEDARRLRGEAEALLAEYRKKHDAAEQEAASIVAEARAEAERFAVESRITIAAQIERRGRQAEEKIAQAEAQAVAELRGLAADAAIAAAQRLIAARLDDNQSADLIKRSLGEIPSKLN
ncbi:MAG TPA: ATP F0F1 synthase subunit B [Micropepsaceae bacterium]|jgi:F-type H+-transporting ATPase subunit b|nr:ATP F0F1 synthase subunit B [Micropepsaceae bacterium]